MTEKNLDDLKKEYKEIQGKFNLPSFEGLNMDFQIEKIADECETDYLIREIRKFITEKFSNYLRFTEAILNPVSTPMFIFSFIRCLGADEKNKLSEIYKKLAKNELDAIACDVSFSPEKEAEFIKKSYALWQDVKKDFLDVLEIVKKNWNNEVGKNSKGYFG